jgi:hypothetical protein
MTEQKETNWLVKLIKNRSIEKKKREIEDLKLDIEIAKLKKELKEI